MIVIDKIAKIALAALNEAFTSLDQANASETMDQARGHIGHAIIALDTALQYAAAAVDFEIEGRKKLPN